MEAVSQHAAVLDALPVPVLLSMQELPVYANVPALELFGVSGVMAFATRSVLDAVDPYERPRVEAVLRAGEAGHKIPGPVECRLTGASGEMHVVEWRVEPVELGPAWAALSVISDVTNIAATRDVLAGAEARQREIFEALAEGVIVVDASGVCVDANRAAAELLRLGEPELLMGAPAEAMPLVEDSGEPVEWERHPVWRALWGETVVAESFGVRFSSRVRTMQVSARPVYALETSEPVGAAITFADVTDRIAAEAELAASEARFRNLAAMAPVGIFEADTDGALVFVNDEVRPS